MEFPPRHYPGAASLIEPELLGIESLFSFFGKLKSFSCLRRRSFLFNVTVV